MYFIYYLCSIWKLMNKNCIFCNSSNVKKNEHWRNIQMYFCRDCGRQFQSGQRIDNICLWNGYLTEKRTISKLSILHKYSERTIRRRLSSVAESFTPFYPISTTIILDTTYFSKTLGIMLLHIRQDTSSKVCQERNQQGLPWWSQMYWGGWNSDKSSGAR